MTFAVIATMITCLLHWHARLELLDPVLHKDHVCGAHRGTLLLLQTVESRGLYLAAVRFSFHASADAWHRSGDLLADMARQEGLEIARVSKAIANDILIALSCREAGCVLVTENERDFSRIRRFISFEFMMLLCLTSMTCAAVTRKRSAKWPRFDRTP
jgi:hypothetical protein